MMCFIVMVLIAACCISFYLMEYYGIDLYNTIYYNRTDSTDKIVVISKSLLTVTIARIEYEPEDIPTIEFLINYTAKY